MSRSQKAILGNNHPCSFVWKSLTWDLGVIEGLMPHEAYAQNVTLCTLV